MLPKQYEWLSLEPGPKMLKEALRHYGTLEKKGLESNPDITRWAKEVGGSVADVYKNDGIPWCGLFMAIVAKRSGKEVPGGPLWALNWANFGVKVSQPMLGDVLVFKRPEGGHVALYVGEDKVAWHIIGGNQKDQVCFIRIGKERLYAARRPVYNIQPANVRKIELSPTGMISTNEQ